MLEGWSLRFRYVVKGIKGRCVKVLLFCCMIGLILFFPLHLFEDLQNNMYVFVSSPTLISSSDVKLIDGWRWTNYVVCVSCEVYGNVTVLNVNGNFRKFACKFLVDGRLPRGVGEAAAVVLEDTNVNVGDFLSVGNGSVRVVGLLDIKCVPLIGEVVSAKVILVKIVDEEVFDSRALVVGLSCFANVSDVLVRLENLLGENVLIDASNIPFSKIRFVNVFAVCSLAANVAVTFLIVLDIRKDCAILFSVGWLPRDVFGRIVLETVVLNLLGFLVGFVVLYVETVFILKYYFFINIYVFILMMLTLLSSVFSSYIFSRFLVFKKGVEVLVT